MAFYRTKPISAECGRGGRGRNRRCSGKTRCGMDFVTVFPVLGARFRDRGHLPIPRVVAKGRAGLAEIAGKAMKVVVANKSSRCVTGGT